MLRSRAAVAVVVATAALASGCSSGDTARDSTGGTVTGTPGQGSGKVTTVSFTETDYSGGHAGASPSDSARPGTVRKVRIRAVHDAGRITSLHFTTRVQGELFAERSWKAAKPDTVRVRNWRDCTQSDQPMPKPRPSSVPVVLTELFGPRHPPADAETDRHGNTSWRVHQGMADVRFTDHGGDYPDRTVRISGPDGGVGSVIDDSAVSNVPAAPGWTGKWSNCGSG